MSLQGTLNKMARDMLPLCTNYTQNELDSYSSWAANCRGMLDQWILNTNPPLDRKTPEQLNEFDSLCLNRLYQCSNDERFDEDIQYGFKSYKELKV